MNDKEFIKGKGAQYNPKNKFARESTDLNDEDVVQEFIGKERPQTQIFIEHPKKIINRYESPDVPGEYSVNAYQGCEHGCVYCYARESHQYWGFSAGLDFESKIIVKQNAPELLSQEFRKKSYKPGTIMLSGNTDCYQPIEKQHNLTRRLLEVMLEFRNPVGIITKNSLVERDVDILREMATMNLAHVFFSITTLDEDLRRKLEPRTASAEKKFAAMRTLVDAGIPVGVMAAPIIPGLNHHEIPQILQRSAENGATAAGYTVVRLNGEIGEIFQDWLALHYPDRKDKVIHQIEDLHGGNLQDRRFGTRMRGEGPQAEIIKQLFQVSKSKYFANKPWPRLTIDQFRRGGDWELF